MELESNIMNKKVDYSGNTIGKYYLISRIGNGSFGVVYRAFDRVLSVEKAIKILEVSNPKEAYKLFSEAAIPYNCTHNNIVKINNGELINFNGEIVFVVDMELINGFSVEEILKRSEASVVWSINVIRNLLFAVEFSHIQGNIHRDIKPANILIDNGIPKLSDFGLASALGSVIIPWKWYRTHAAPETFVNASIATVQTDIFALGMTLYRMVNGIADWNLFLSSIPNAENLIVSGKLIDKLPKSPIVPDKVYRIIKKACNKSPEKRYSSATEMRNAIEKLLLLYDWKPIDDYHWRGQTLGGPIKEIYIESKRKHVEVVVTNNNRKSSHDSRKFENIIEATNYMFEYIKETTIQ